MVELIVVLVILAILAAIMVPALTGWIEKAKEKQLVIDARTAYLAAQTLASEAYGKGSATTGTISSDDIQKLAGIDGTLAGSITMKNLATGGATQINLSYSDNAGKNHLDYDGKEWTLVSTAKNTGSDVTWTVE